MYHKYGLMEAFENQRHWGVMWGPPMLPGLDWPAWSDAGGQPIELLRPPTVDGQGGWYVVRSASTDDEGWLYGTSFDRLHQPRPGGRASKRVNDQVRSRVWRRLNTDKELQPVHIEQLAVAARNVEGRHASNKGDHEEVSPARGLLEQAAAGGGQLVLAVTSSSLFKQLPKPSVFKLWQMLMELWNDSAKRHGVLKVAPLDPVGLFLAMKAHTSAATEQRRHALKAGKVIIAGGYIAPSTAASPNTQPSLPSQQNNPRQPNWDQLSSGAADMVVSGPVLGLLQQQPAAQHAASAGQQSPQDKRALSASPSVSQHSTAQMVPHVGPTGAHAIQQRGSADSSVVLLAEPHASLHGRYARRSQPVAASPALWHPTASSNQSGIGVDVRSQLGSIQARQQAASATSQVQASPGEPLSEGATGGHSSRPQSWTWWNGVRSSAQEAPQPVTEQPASHVRSGAPSPAGRASDAAAHGVETSHPYLKGILPDVVDAGALVKELMVIVNYTRAAYGYVMAAGHMANISSFLTMVGTSAFFNPVSGASAEANNEAIFTLTGIPQSDILLAEWRNQVFRPCHFLAVDRAHRRLVLCVRGSVELGDICTDLAAMPVEVTFGGGLGACHVHHGLISAALYVEQTTRAALMEAAHKFPDWPLLITGHSLGAGVASLLAIIHKYGHGLQSSPSVWASRVFCVGVACPPAVSPHVADACRDFIVTLVNHMDFVPRLSHYSVELALMDMVKSSPMAQLADNLSSTLSMVTQNLPWTSNATTADNGGGGNISRSAGGMDGAAENMTGAAAERSVEGQGVRPVSQQSSETGAPDHRSSDRGAQAAGRTGSGALQMQETAQQVEIELMPQRSPYTAALQLGRLRRTASDVGAVNGAVRLEPYQSCSTTAAGEQAVSSKSDAALDHLSGSFTDVQAAFSKLWFGAGNPEGGVSMNSNSLARAGQSEDHQDVVCSMHAVNGDAQQTMPTTPHMQERPEGGKAIPNVRSGQSAQAGLQQVLGSADDQTDGCWSGIVEVVKTEAQAAVQAVQALPASLDASLHSTLDVVTAVGCKAVQASAATSSNLPTAETAIPDAKQPSATQSLVPPAASTEKPAGYGVAAAPTQAQRPSTHVHNTGTIGLDHAQHVATTTGSSASPFEHGVKRHPLFPAEQAADVQQPDSPQPASLSAVMDQVTESLEAAAAEKQREQQGSSKGSQPVNVASLSKKEVADRLAPTKLYPPGRILWVLLEPEHVVRRMLAELHHSQGEQGEQRTRGKVQRHANHVASSQPGEQQAAKCARNNHTQHAAGTSKPAAAVSSTPAKDNLADNKTQPSASQMGKHAGNLHADVQLVHKQDGGTGGNTRQDQQQGMAQRSWQLPAASAHAAQHLHSHPVAVAVDEGHAPASAGAAAALTGDASVGHRGVIDTGETGGTSAGVARASASALVATGTPAAAGVLLTRTSDPLPGADSQAPDKRSIAAPPVYTAAGPRSFSINTSSSSTAQEEVGAQSATPLGLSVQGITQSFKQLKSTVENVISKATNLTTGSAGQGGDSASVLQKGLLAGLSPSTKSEQQEPQQAVCLLEAQKELFEELSLVASCAGDHIPDSYFAALSQLHASLLAGSAFGHAVHTGSAAQFSGQLASPDQVPGESASHSSTQEAVQSLQVADTATQQAAASKAVLPLRPAAAVGMGARTNMTAPSSAAQATQPSRARYTLADLLRLT